MSEPSSARRSVSSPYVWIDPFEDREPELATIKRRSFDDGYRQGKIAGSSSRMDYSAARRSVAKDIRQYKTQLNFTGDIEGMMRALMFDACAIIAEQGPRQ